MFLVTLPRTLRNDGNRDRRSLWCVLRTKLATVTEQDGHPGEEVGGRGRRWATDGHRISAERRF